MQTLYAGSLARTSFTLVMLAIAGGMALALGLLGIYGVIAYIVSQRSREIGIRLALGAEPRDVGRMFVRHGLKLAGLGVAIGLVAALGVTRLMASLLFGVGADGPGGVSRGARGDLRCSGACELSAGAHARPPSALSRR